MKTLNFLIKIKASKEKVWNVLWDDETYRKWTSTFSEGLILKEDFSTKILEKNNFILLGTVHNPGDGEVWEWYLP